MTMEAKQQEPEESQLRHQGTGRQLQKGMVARMFTEAVKLKDEGGKVAFIYNGGPQELLRCFNIHSLDVKISALQTGVKKVSLPYILKAQEYGYNPDVCGYVMVDVGVALSGMEHPLGRIPVPDLVVQHISCNTYLKWSEIIQDFHGTPIATLDIPSRPSREYADLQAVYENDKQYVMKQVEELVQTCEEISGIKFDPYKLAAELEESNHQSALWREIIYKNTHIPAPFDTMLEGLNYLGGQNSSRGTKEGQAYMEAVIAELDERIAHGIGAVPEERFRVLIDGTPCWPYMRKFMELFKQWGVVFVYSTYTSGTGGVTTYRFDPTRPIESYAEYMLRGHPAHPRSEEEDTVGVRWGGWLEGLQKLVRRFSVDCVVFHAIKSCRLFSTAMADQREHLIQAGIPALLLESDIVDPRYFSEAQLRNRIDAFFEALEQKKFRQSAGSN